MQIYTIPVTDTEGTKRLIIYRPLASLAFVGNQAMADLALALGNGIAVGDTAEGAAGDTAAADFLRRSGFLEPDPPAPAGLENDFCPTTTVLLLTNQCQLRCSYCYASAGEYERQELPFELGKAAIDLVCENAQSQGQPHFDVSFHGGGEPTMAWKSLQAFVAYARQKPLTAKISLTTNGIWSAKQCKWLTEHLDGISLSMDGTPETQNRHRPRVSGHQSSSKVMEVVAELDRLDFPYGIRMTATAPWDDFPKDVRFLCESTTCQALQVEPAFNTQRGGHGQAEEIEGRAFADAFLEAHAIARQAGRKLHYSGARLGLVTTTFCTAPYQALIVNAGGNLVTCYEVASDAHALARLSNIGRIDDGKVIIETAARQRMLGMIAERRAACQDCFCYWSCAGDCYTRSFVSGENGHLQYGARCEMNRYILKMLLLRAIAEGEGVWRSSNARLAQLEQSPVASLITI